MELKSTDLNILVAIPYCKPTVIEELSNIKNLKFYLDSGAFTAWKAGKVITIDQYCRFISDLKIKPWRYFTLDVIGDPKKTKENFIQIKKNGFNPVPIFTRGEDLKELDFYYDHSDCVAIGGLVGTSGNKGYVKGLMKYIGNRKTHWLGFNAKEYLSHYKPYSCDSSSWNFSFRYASAKIYDRNGIWIPFTKNDFINKPSQSLLKLILELDVDPKRLSKSSEWSNSNKDYEYAIESITYRTWLKYQNDIYNKLNVLYFLACSTDGQVKLFNRAQKFWNQKLNKLNTSSLASGLSLNTPST